jgi:Spy/CpxP family protein refolding chaperone
MTSIRRIVLAATLAALGGAAFVLASPAAAQAAAATGADYGQHVRVCTQVMGFSGDHNPGMHQGYAGWDATDCSHCG